MMNLKILSLLLGAILSLGAVLAITASADEEEFEFHSDGSFTTFVGAAKSGSVSTIDAGQIKCASVTYHGVMNSSTTENVELEPSSKECTWALGTVTEDWNGCTNRFDPDVATSAFVYDTTDYLVCPPGKELTITMFSSGVLKCTVHIPPQDLGTSEWFENASGKQLLDRKFTKRKYTQTAGTGIGACANASNTTNGEYVEELELEARNSEGKETEFWLE